ncbi:hypothetical protein PoB_004243700 [Plakobranchus ocellatus]|uniref:Uncharacterized protein n=1 Tax=Plakobranchus ocellatus TaxID=259542 RepID=A0AAV4B9W9_9GAST|nr:hypothetical protein PoB_004243700 [Plakobranchus ocellatus]
MSAEQVYVRHDAHRGPWSDPMMDLSSKAFEEDSTNEEVRRRIKNAIGSHVDLLTIVRQRKLKWYGHTTRSSGLAKTIMQGTVNGGRRNAGKTKSENGQDLS